MQQIQNQSLKNFHTFHIPVSARWFVSYDSLEELQQLLQGDLLKQYPHLHIGSGSNLLFTVDFPGVILHSQMKSIEILSQEEHEVLVEVSNGVVWDDFCAWAVKQGLYGVENLSHIPGEVGASAVQNIGAYGVEVSDVIERVHALRIADGQAVSIPVSECDYAYRYSRFKGDWKGKYIITSVVYRLKKQAKFHLAYGNLDKHIPDPSLVTLEQVRALIIQIRDQKLPNHEVYGNAGSFFINPVIERKHYDSLLVQYPNMPFYPINESQVKVPAGWLIEQCGWKGKGIGGAAVHEQQCLVLINKHEATASDVIALAKAVQESVQEKFGIVITPEVNYIGE